jgi:succinate dehydrogenase hydrophobic anchor subunit|uniref:Succinate dehydrogenase subunit 4 n=1 Tax=Diphylleia rotans TaxID=190327 RepID=A0A146I6N5_9EUKA|nr:succinate dehydrogenase subunit 4 [Diphylleia rotans]BAU71443.1 succinate dehydrogenase subunit 4 [Diphylleia rotans]
MRSSLVWILERLTALALAIILLFTVGAGLLGPTSHNFDQGAPFILSEVLMSASSGMHFQWSLIFSIGLCILFVHIFLGVLSIMEDYIHDSYIFKTLAVIVAIFQIKVIIIG